MSQILIVPLNSTPKCPPRTVEGVGGTTLGTPLRMTDVWHRVVQTGTVVLRCVPHDAIGSGTIQKSSVRGGTSPPSIQKINQGETSIIHLYSL